MDYLKAVELGKNKWRVLAIPFGGPFEGKDFDEEFFSARTDIKADWFDRRPLLWHHAQDKTVDEPVIGTADDTELEDDGWWSTVWLNRTHRYWAEVDRRIRDGKIFGSSGALPHMVRKDHKTGEILVWPYIEQTLTPTPANPYSRVVAAKALSHFDEAGIDLSPAVRGLLLPDLDSLKADLGPDLETAVDPATRERLSGALASLLERTNRI